MNFQDILKRRLQDIHGFAGGSLGDQLAQNPQVLTARNRDAITRPRTQPVPPSPIGANDGPPIEGTPEWQTAMSRAVPVRANETPQPAASMADPNATRQRAVSFDPQTGRPNENFYRDRGDISGLYNAEQNWNSHGAKRGFKNSLKSAAMMAAEAVRNNPNHPLEAAIAGAGVGAIGGTAAPNFKNRLERQWKLQQTGGELQNQLQLQGEQAKIDSLGMTPVRLADGTIVMAPVKSAGGLASQQQGVKQRQAQDDAHRKRWDAMTSRDARRDAQALYNSGGADESEDLRAEIAHRMGLPEGTTLPPHTQGRIETDASGNFVVVDPRSRTAKPVTEGDQPVGSFQGTLEKGRNRRATASQVGADRRAGMRGNGTTAKPNAATTRRAALLIGQIKRSISAIGEADARLAKDPNDREAQRMRNSAKQAGAGWAAELNALGAGYEAGVGEKDYPYVKATEQHMNEVMPQKRSKNSDPLGLYP